MSPHGKAAPLNSISTPRSVSGVTESTAGPSDRPTARPKLLGHTLLESGALQESELERALEEQLRSGLRLGEILLIHHVVEEEEIGKALARQLALGFHPAPLNPALDADGSLPFELLRSRGVVPLRWSDRRVVLAMADPLDIGTIDEIQFRTGRRVEVIVASRSAIREALDADGADELAALVDALTHSTRGASEGEPDGEEVNSAPVVQMVDYLIREAIDARASDIHLEPMPDHFRARFRVDGILGAALELPTAVRGTILSRLKVMADLDISVKRRPQDGMIALRHRGKPLTLRISTLPSKDGEKCVVRVLDPSRAPKNLDALGLSADDVVRLRGLIHSGQGVLLATGPTGSGKSSTLFGALGEVDRDRANVTTLEDPVEYRLPGATQVHVDERSGLTFPAALRAVLRQDPDVVMVGEIRDRETAEIAMAAAVTGHLVLSTLHTTDAPGAIARLLDMGVPPYLVAGGLAGVVAQRLVRTLCRICGGRDARKCSECSDGYEGRTGVFQVLVMTDALRDEVVNGASTTRLRKLAEQDGMLTLSDDARRKVAEGVTTPHEVSRVIQLDPGASSPCPRCRMPVPRDAIGCPNCGAHRTQRCRCGERTRREWRFCPSCMRPVSRTLENPS